MRKVVLVVLISVFMFSFVTQAYALPSHSDHVITRTTSFVTGSLSSGPDVSGNYFGYVNLMTLYPELSGDTIITRIKGRVKYDGGQWFDGSFNVNLAEIGSMHHNSLGKRHLLATANNSNWNWVNFDVPLSFSQSYGCLQILSRIFSGGGWYLAKFTVEINEIHYTKFNFLYTISVNNDRYIVHKIDRSIVGFPFRVEILAMSGFPSQNIYGGGNYLDQSYTFVDTAVVPEKTFSFQVGVSVIPTNPQTYIRQLGTFSIKVPSDATHALDAAITARDAAIVARDVSHQANHHAWLSAARSWYTGTYGGAPESAADLAGYIRNTQLPQLETKISSLETVINNTNTPPTINVQTLSGARATSGSSIQASITVSGKESTNFTYSINGGAYTPLPGNGIVSLPVTSPGNNTITVRVKDEAGNVGMSAINIRKL